MAAFDLLRSVAEARSRRSLERNLYRLNVEVRGGRSAKRGGRLQA